MPPYSRRMGRSAAHRARAGALLSGALILLALPAVAHGESATPLPARDYAVVPVCRRPAPRHSSCLAQRLVPLTRAAHEHRHPIGVPRAAVRATPSTEEGDLGIRPQDIHSAYSLPVDAPAGATVAIVDAFNDVNVQADLNTYSSTFSLPACTTANGCLTVENQKGNTEASALPFPKSESELKARAKGGKHGLEEAEDALGWDEEISLDVDTVHATCQNCKILLVEAEGEANEALFEAETTAEAAKPSAISNSWGTPETASERTEFEAAPFDDPGTVITAAAGDDGYLDWEMTECFEEAEYDLTPPSCRIMYAEGPEFPASSPDVVGVGGTRLTLTEKDEWASETVWNGTGAGGSGCSMYFDAQKWQRETSTWADVGCGEKRAVADVAADASPHSGLAVYDSNGGCEEEDAPAGWCTIGGTSLASPMIAATFALAGGANGVAYPAQTLYENEAGAPSSLHDITVGSNGACAKLGSCTEKEEEESCVGKIAICSAGVGYDGPSGVGTPDGLTAFTPPKEKTERAHALDITSLVITPRALAAFRAHGAHGRTVSFTLRASAAGRVRARLYRLTRSGHREVWRAAGVARVITLKDGASSWRLTFSVPLRAGRYTLTLSPLAAGRGRSVKFRIA